MNAPVSKAKLQHCVPTPGPAATTRKRRSIGTTKYILITLSDILGVTRKSNGVRYEEIHLWLNVALELKGKMISKDI